MFKYQFRLLAIATLLLSPTVVHAAEFGESTNLTVGKMQIQTNRDGSVSIQSPTMNINTTQPDGKARIQTPNIDLDTAQPDGKVRIQTPNIDLNTAQPAENRVFISRNRRRVRKTVRTKTVTRNGRVISSPSIIGQPSPNSDNRSVINNTTRSSSTVQTSSDGNHSTNHQRSSVQCSPGSNSVIKSSQTINGRTVTSEVRCP